MDSKNIGLRKNKDHLRFWMMCIIQIEFGNEYGPEHILDWIMQLIVLKMDVIVDEMLLRLCAGCVMDNLGSPDIGVTLPKFR